MNIKSYNICDAEKIYDEYHRLYKRCNICNSKHSLKYYSNNKYKKLKGLK